MWSEKEKADVEYFSSTLECCRSTVNTIYYIELTEHHQIDDRCGVSIVRVEQLERRADAQFARLVHRVEKTFHKLDGASRNTRCFLYRRLDRAH